MITNLDRVEESKINLHGPSLRSNHGLGRCDNRVGHIHSAIQAGFVPQERIGQSVDAHKDGPAKYLRYNDFGCHAQRK